MDIAKEKNLFFVIQKLYYFFLHRKKKENLWERLLVLKYLDMKKNKLVARLPPQQSSLGNLELGINPCRPQVYDFCRHPLLCSHPHFWSILTFPHLQFKDITEGGACNKPVLVLPCPVSKAALGQCSGFSSILPVA